jgi:hypothetical protein
MPGAWLVSLSPACATGATMKANVTNKKPVNPFNFLIVFVLFEVSSWLQLDAHRNGYAEQVDRRF